MPGVLRNYFEITFEAAENGNLASEEGCVAFREGCPFFRQIVKSEDSRHRTDGDASTAIDAIVGVHVELGNIGKVRFVLLGVDAIHRAGLYAQLVLGAGVGDYVCHMRWVMQLPCQR